MKHLLITSLAVFSISAQSAIADDEFPKGERALVVKAVQELEYIKQLLDKANNNRNKKSRLQLDYDTLNQDLSDIQAALTRHAEQPRRLPRRVNPLKKTYTRN